MKNFVNHVKFTISQDILIYGIPNLFFRFTTNWVLIIEASFDVNYLLFSYSFCLADSKKTKTKII